MLKVAVACRRRSIMTRSRLARTTRPIATMPLPRIASRMTANASWPTRSVQASRRGWALCNLHAVGRFLGLGQGQPLRIGLVRIGERIRARRRGLHRTVWRVAATCCHRDRCGCRWKRLKPLQRRSLRHPDPSSMPCCCGGSARPCCATARALRLSSLPCSPSRARPARRQAPARSF